MIVIAIAMLLMASLFIILRHSWKTVKHEAVEKASQALETTVLRIDNVLFSVEQATGNMMWNILQNLDQPERMFTYSRKLVESNPYIDGCAIAFEPYYYSANDKYFMAYVHRFGTDSLATVNTPIIQAETFGNRPYLEQEWYTMPIEQNHPVWIGPIKEYNTSEEEALISFCQPLYNTNRQKAGVLAVDISISVLSKIVLAAKPSPDSYSVLLGKDGSFIVHPDQKKLFHETVFTQTEQGVDPTVREAAQAMVAGETGYKFFRMNGAGYYVFYKPFRCTSMSNRYVEDLGWSIGIIYPENDIFGGYDRLSHYVLCIALIGLLVLLVLCLIFTRNLLLPLRLLTNAAQRIAEGHYGDTIPESHHSDEIGQLQANFQHMQQSLATRMDELQRLTTDLKERGEVLAKTYEQAKEADRMKTAFLHNMTNQMATPVNAIHSDVKTLSDGYYDLEQQDIDKTVQDILEQGKNVTTLLKDLLEVSQNTTDPTSTDHVPSA